jgi:hypothetical protein
VNFLTALPMAVVMVAGTQLIGAVFLATGRVPVRTSLAYLSGAAAAVLAGASVAYWLVRLLRLNAGMGRGAVGRWIDVVVLVLLVLLAVLVFGKRHQTDPPAWMRRLETARPGLAAALGALLILLMPSDDLTMITVGASLARHDRAWWHLLPFVVLTVLLLALPLLGLLLLGDRARVWLPRLRDWANANSWLVSEVMIGFFVALTLVSLLR